MQERNDMHRLKEAMPSPSMIVAIVALVAALGGSAYAASQITGKDIKNNSITSPKVKNKMRPKRRPEETLG